MDSFGVRQTVEEEDRGGNAPHLQQNNTLGGMMCWAETVPTHVAPFAKILGRQAPNSRSPGFSNRVLSTEVNGMQVP